MRCGWLVGGLRARDLALADRWLADGDDVVAHRVLHSARRALQPARTLLSCGMSLHSFTRKGLPPGSASSGPVCVVGHGAGGPHWGRSHPLVQLALERTPQVLSLQLPFHGDLASPQCNGFKDATHEQKKAAVAQVIEQVFALLAQALRGRYVIFIGYSTSGLLFLKLFNRLIEDAVLHPASMLVCIGTGLCIDSTQALIQAFWSESSFEADPKRHAAMRALHRPAAASPAAAAAEDDASWRNCVRFVAFAAAVADSGLFSTPDERVRLFQSLPLPFSQRQSPPPAAAGASHPPRYVFFVNGASDEPFPTEECISAPLRECVESTGVRRDLTSERLTVIDGATHFNLFAPNKQGGYLEQVLAQTNRLVDTYSERDLLAPKLSAKLEVLAFVLFA